MNYEEVEKEYQALKKEIQEQEEAKRLFSKEA
jgi:hypothetical protein